MPASQEQKVDFLLKKIGYSASKTGIAEDESAIGLSTNTAKAPFEEGIPSPLIIPSTNILSDSSFIPTTPPVSDTAYVKVYPTTSALRMTRDSTVGTATRTYIAYTTYNDTSSARLTNWIDTQFGSSYILKVFKDDPTVPANELQQAGAGGGTDGWFFDYSSGVLNFNGNALPSGISATNIYIVGYRYIGATGVQPPAGIGTFHDLVVSNNLSVGGISTLSKEVGIGSALNVSGITTFKDDVEFHGASGITSAFFDKSDNSFKFIDNVKAKFGTNNNLEIYHNPVNSYIANNSNNLYITNTDGEIFIQAKAGEDSIICHDDGAVQLYHDNALKCQTRDFGFSIFQDLRVSNNLDVSGVSTFTGNIDANGIIEATAGQNKIPSLYQNFSDLPNAGTYHGMFAHVHALGRGYFAHGGAWYELVNKESNGVVGTGTEKYNLGFTDTVNLKVTGITTLGSIGISTGIISGPSVTYIDPAAVGDNTGTVVIKGDLQVDGTQTIVNSSTMTVTDKNIEMAVGAANDAAADGGGITVKSGDGDKTWRWLNGTDSWTSSEHIRIPDGKVFGFASDTNTYIHRPAADVIAFTTNAEERLRINNVGDVGIGTTNPQMKLVVSTDGNGIEFNPKVGGTNDNRILSYDRVANVRRGLEIDAQSFEYRKDLETRLKILSDGKVGIGTDNPGALLHLKGTGGNTSGIRFENGAGESLNMFFAGDNSNSQFSLNYGGTGQNDIIFTHDGNIITNQLHGGLGIGTYNPSGKLEVLGDSNLKGNLNVTGVTTFTGISTFSSTIVSQKSVQIEENLNVTGITTFNGAIILPPGTGGNFGNINIAVTGNNEIDTDSGNLIIDSAGGTINIDDGLTVAGVSTFTGNIVATGNIAANGNINGDNATEITGISKVIGSGAAALTLENVHYVGRSSGSYAGSFLHFNDQNIPSFGGGGNFTTLASISGLNLIYDTNNNDNNGLVIGSGSTNTSLMTTHMVVSHQGRVGIGSTIPTSILDVNGRSELDNVNIAETLNVVGVSTFTGAIDANGDLDVDGRSELDNVNIAETLNVVGISTLSKEVGIGSALNVAGVSTFTGAINANSNLTTNGTLLISSVAPILKFTETDNSKNYFIVGDSNSLSVRMDNTGGGNIIQKWNSNGTHSFYNKVFFNDDIDVTGLTETDTLTTGNATFTGTISAGSTTGTDGYYLQSTGVGVTWAQFPTMRTNQVFTATADQTTFSFSYNVGFLDVFVNGVKLPTSEFTASNGSSVILDDGCFVNDTVELISYNTVPSSGSGAQTLNQLDNVTITGVPVIGETLQHNGSAFVNDYTPSATTTSTSQTAILSLATATYRSVEYTVQITEGTKYHVTKILAIHDGTNVSFNEYGTLFTTSSLATFALDVNSGNMRLLATPASTNSTVFKVKFTGIKV